jgi:hypothetical protein
VCLCLQSRWLHVAVSYNPTTGMGAIFWDANLKIDGAMPQPQSIVRGFHYVGKSNAFGSEKGLAGLGE